MMELFVAIDFQQYKTFIETKIFKI